MMRRLSVLVTFVALYGFSSVFGENPKGNFALTFQGGGFGNLEDRFFKSLAFVVTGGAEYYPINPVSAGIQFQFSPKGSFGGPVSLGVGSVSGSGFRRSDQLFQTTLFARPTLYISSGTAFFALVGASWTKVTRTESGIVVPATSDGSENEGDKIGGKFGAGSFVRLKSNVHLNFTAAYDTQPQKLFSTQAGLTFFFNPFVQKNEWKNSKPQMRILSNNLLSCKGYK